MNELIEKKVSELYNLLMEKPRKILEIFNDFFGEDRVDMQGFMSIDEFKQSLSTKIISGYISKDILGMSLEEWNTYKSCTIINLKEEILDKVLEVLCSNQVVTNIGNNLFKQGFILVHFPSVRITNEYDKYVDIKHLYAKINIYYNGSGDGIFGLNRAEYSYLHISSNYMHSHVGSIPTHNFTVFQTPCTGRGPINSTLSNLAREYSEDLWRLFCLELDKYVQVESIEGVPYHRLEQLGTSRMTVHDNVYEVINSFLPTNGAFTLDKAKEFTKYFINTKKLKFNYKHNSYSIGMPFNEFIVLISNEFIKWYNAKFNRRECTNTLESLLRSGLLNKGIISGNKVYFKNSSIDTVSYANYVGKRICTFKGKDVRVVITDIEMLDDRNMSYLLNPKIALYLLARILNVINYRYGKSEQRDSEGNTISEKIRYV